MTGSKGPKAVSVTKEGADDGFAIPAVFRVQRDDAGPARLLASIPTPFLRVLHRDLVRALGGPVGVLYRQRINRSKPRPEGAPPRDFLALDLDTDVALAAFDECADLVYHDARHELWVRGPKGEQVVLDGDGLLYCYPDDAVFRDVCRANGLSESDAPTLLDRDYVKHAFHADCDALEAGLIDGLGLSEMPVQR